MGDMSTVVLDGDLYVAIKIDGKSIPASLPNFLVQTAVIENVAGVPVLTMIINDGEGYLSEECPFTDGNKISIVIASDLKDLADNKSLDFRLFNWEGVQFQKGFRYEINALFDNHKYVTEVDQKAYVGTSDYVIKRVAEDCGLDYVGDDSCVDTQTWLNFSDTLSTFAKKVVQHSYLQNGCMSVALTADGSLIYKDIVKAINGKSALDFHSTSPDAEKGEILLQEFKPSSSAGFMNAWLNYGYVCVENFLSGKDEVYDSIKLTTTSGGSAVVNTDVANDLKAVRKDYIVQDCGNTHSRYWKTFHNNIRVLGLFSQKMIFLVDKVTNLSLLDVVNLTIINSNTGKPITYSGKYIIGAKKTLVKGTKYAEIFEVYRNTVPKQGTAILSNKSESGGTKNVSQANAPAETMVVDTITDPSGSK